MGKTAARQMRCGRSSVAALRKLGIHGEGNVVEVNHDLMEVDKKGTKMSVPAMMDAADKLEYVITSLIHPLLPYNDSVLIVMNDILCADYLNQWHSKPKYVAAAKQCRTDLVIVKQAKLSDDLTEIVKPSSGVTCQVVTPLITDKKRREEYLILSHPSDAQATLLSLRLPHTVEVSKRLALSAGNMAIVTCDTVTAHSCVPLPGSDDIVKEAIALTLNNMAMTI